MQDEQIKQKIVDRMASDSRVDASDVKVMVDNGQVTLTGTVPTFTNKSVATDISWNVMGVIKVDNLLNVKFPTAFTIPTDSQIKSSIDQLLKWNADVDQDKVSVSVDGGVVTLEGSLPSYWQKIKAEEDASRASGVIDVINKLAVVPSQKVSDEIVGERVMDRIEQSNPLYVDRVTARVNAGKVTLSGSLPSYNIWRSIYDTTQNTLGVTDIMDNINIVAT